jgi:hypothetical protein
MMAEAQKIEMISENLKRYWLHDERIVVFEPTGISHATVDAWHDSTLESARNTPLDKPYHELHDLRKTNLTPYSRQKALELVKALGDRSGRSAIIIAKSYEGQLIGFFVNNIFSRIPKNRPRRVFTDFQQGLKWLEEGL